MGELTIILVALAAAFFLFNQLAILSQIRILRDLFGRLDAQMNPTQATAPSTADTRPSATSRRIKFRARTAMPGVLEIEGKSQAIIVDDISQTGAMVKCDKSLRLTLNEEYPFSTQLPSGSDISARFKVIRIVDAQANQYGGFFVNLPLAEKKALTQYVNQSAQDNLNQDIAPKSAHENL